MLWRLLNFFLIHNVVFLFKWLFSFRFREEILLEQGEVKLLTDALFYQKLPETGHPVISYFFQNLLSFFFSYYFYSRFGPVDDVPRLFNIQLQTALMTELIKSYYRYMVLCFTLVGRWWVGLGRAIQRRVQTEFDTSRWECWRRDISAA